MKTPNGPDRTPRICQLCSEIIKPGLGYYETWEPYPQVHCIPCHAKRTALRKAQRRAEQ